MKAGHFPDAFAAVREKDGVAQLEDQNDPVQMVLRLKDLRRCAHDWKTFQSAAQPGRIVVPSEVNIRDDRQIPFELDPPEHTAFRALVEPWFKRPGQPAYQEALLQIIESAVDTVAGKQDFDVVLDFALPIQSKALTVLLNVPMAEAATWISWGTHVFRSEGDPLDGDKAQVLYRYIDAAITKAAAQPGDDMYSVLLASEYDGRKLTHEEVKGIMILTFAGGRDTVINAITNTMAYLADNPSHLEQVKNHPEIISHAVEELMRYFSPLTQMGRVATNNAEVCGHAVKADTRISLCWASANRDAAVFDNPNEVVLDRKVNPHVAFGFGIHNCLGATHARQLLKTLLSLISRKISAITVLEADENIEPLDGINRKVGYHKLVAQLHSK